MQNQYVWFLFRVALQYGYNIDAKTPHTLHHMLTKESYKGYMLHHTMPMYFHCQ